MQTAPAAPALGGDAYWLADGGKWHVHGESLQISQGPSGLTGTVSWNAGPCNGPYNNNPSAAGQMCEGSSQLTFASQLDGSLAGTFTTNPTYRAWSGGSIGNYQPSSGDPKAGETFTLVPLQAHFAKGVPDTSGVGNPYLCQDGLDAVTVRACGA